VPIQVAIEIRGDALEVDFAGSAPQVAGAINCTLSFAKSAVYFAVRAVMDADVPNNAGFVRPITVRAEPGTIVNPRPPGAVAARGVTGFRVIDALFGALAQAVPERVRGAGEGGTTSYSIAGYDGEGRYRMFREAIMGHGHEGLDGAANPACNIGNAPIEVVETQAPITVERYELVPDSGGPGRWRGGLAVLRQLRYHGSSATLQLRSDRRRHPPFGVCGGLPGAPSQNLLLEDGLTLPLPTKFVRPLKGGQALRHVTAGAGGYGDPLTRDPERVLADVRDGKVSAEAAARDYGVVVAGPPWRLDQAGTAALRRVAAAQIQP
jgi:N-methylhydantoinase B